MNSKPKNKSDFKEFTNLIEELEAPEIRPYAPKLAADYKTGLRYKLLQQHKENRLSQSEMFNLWRFAGTVTAAIILLFALLSLVALLSNPAVQTEPQEGIGAPVRRTPAASSPVDITNSAIVFGDRVQLVGYQIEPVAEGISLQLSWLPLAILDGKFHLFVHLIDENGNLAWQVDTPVSDEMPLISREVQEILDSELTLQTNELADGRYNILVGLYNTETGERLTATSLHNELIKENHSAVLLANWSLTNNTFTTINAGDVLAHEIAVAQATNLAVSLGELLELRSFKLIEGPQLSSEDIIWLDGKDGSVISEGNYLRLILAWRALTDLPHDEYSIFINLLDEQENIIQAQTIPLEENTIHPDPTFNQGQLITQYLLLPLDNDLRPGSYSIAVGLTESKSGESLPLKIQDGQILTENGTAVILTSWEYKPPGSVFISAGKIHELVLYDAPAGNPYDIILDENIELILPTGPDKTVFQVNDTAWASLQWRNNETGESDVCWVSEEIYDRIVDFANYLDSTSED